MSVLVRVLLMPVELEGGPKVVGDVLRVRDCACWFHDIDDGGERFSQSRQMPRLKRRDVLEAAGDYEGEDGGVERSEAWY